MITETPTNNPLSATEQSHLNQKALAVGAWKEGRIQDAQLILDALLEQDLTARVVAECYVAQSAFRADSGDFSGSLESLQRAAPMIDDMSLRIRGSFYHQRGRVYKELKQYDSALTDYAGAEILWEECGIVENQGAAVLNVAGCYLALSDCERAQANITRAFNLLRPINSFYLCQAHDTQAKIYLAQNMPARAAQSIQAALDTVGDNDVWRADFLATREEIDARLLEALRVRELPDWDRVRLDIVRRALQKSGGNPAGAAEILGVTRHAVASIVDHHRETLEPYRMERRKRSVIKKGRSRY